MKPLSLFFCICISICVLNSCKKNGGGPQSPDKSLDNLKLLKADSTEFDPADIDVAISHSGDTITVDLPPFTDITRLIPVIEITGKSVSPASRVRQDFSSPVIYTVTARDGSKKQYTVIVNLRGVVYFGSGDKNFYALDAVKGKLLWKDAGGDFSYSDPTIANGIVYAGNIDNYMYAMDAISGTVKWKYNTSSTIESAPTVANGVVYFGNDAARFYALDANTGDVKWQISTGGNISTKPIVLNGVVYFGSDDHYVYALDANNGALKWKYQTGDLINASSPTVADGVLFIGNRDGNLYAVDAATGMLKWKYFDGNISLEMSSPTVANGVVYIGGWYNTADFTKAGSLYAVDAVTGTLKWQALNAIGIGSNPVVANDLLYVTCDDNNLHAVDVNTHSDVWSKQILANGASAAAAGGVVYCGGGGSHNFYALDAKTGNLKWMYPVGNNGLATSTPIIVGKTSL